ncbi:pyruvate kinase [Burkholderiales bacterium GJ-E10]|nr:pyruvate kinase [Burkholderiales bacterium GJ-E10]
MLAVGLAVAAAVAAADDNALPVVSRGECNSAVISRCREPLSDQPVVIDPAFPVGGITRRQWGNILNSIPDAGRIVIFGERLRGPGVHAVFTRNLGTERPEQITRKAPGGALCTTSTRSGSTYCSRSGNVMPGVEPPIVQTWSFHF